MVTVACVDTASTEMLGREASILLLTNEKRKLTDIEVISSSSLHLANQLDIILAPFRQCEPQAKSRGE